MNTPERNSKGKMLAFTTAGAASPFGISEVSARPSAGVVPLKMAVKITRNIRGNAKVKNAAGGLRQKARFVYFTCRMVSAASLNTASPRVGGRHPPAQAPRRQTPDALRP